MSMIIDGTNGLTFNNATVQASAGVVLQVVNATLAGVVSTASSTFSDTGLTLSITPKFSTSKILVICTVPAQSNGSCNCAITLFRGTVAGTIIFGGNGFANMAGSTYSSVASVAYLDSPATTSSTTYTVGFKSGTGSTVWTSVSNTVGTITLMEIA